MLITKIRLEQFRNYLDQQIETGTGVNVFYGNNAQGKTNILEAIYLCACARSHRTSRDQELIMRDHDQYSISIEYINDNGSRDELTIQYLDSVAGDPQRQRASRLIFHNSMRVDRISDLMGLFHAVIFAPEDLMLVKEGPSTRRRYLDLLISQIRPSYFRNLQQYQRQLTQRNKLLKDIRDTGIKKSYDDPMMVQLDVWTSSLAQTAAALIEQRLIFSDRIAYFAAESLNNISSGKEKLNVKYRTISGISNINSTKEISSILYNKLKSIIYEDIARGSTNFGPHRDDLELWLNDEPLKPYASQGQQRSVVLSLKIAELNIIKEDINEYPVLLLDDVMSELDEKRRGCLLANITGAQVFVTCTEADHVVGELEAACTYIPVETARSYDFYQVEAGHVTRIID